MKKYVLTVSRYFPATHKRKGEETHFIDSILSGFLGHKQYTLCRTKQNGGDLILSGKIHTIRANYELWDKRIKEVQEGKAILSIRYWSGKPYNSKQVEIWQMDKDSGIGIQKLEFNGLHGIVNGEWITPDVISKNDGLLYPDFKEWFRKYDLSKPMAIIHFTSFRY
jgi:hypothetical protein